MKFTRNDIFAIAKVPYNLGGDKSNSNIEYLKWVDFIDTHSDHFIWKENTKEGVETLTNIDKVPESFKERVLDSLNKSACYKEFDVKKGFYNINLGFNYIDNMVSIGFERTPKLEDLKIFLAMANHLDAFLLKDGTEIIDERVIDSLG
ncbi:hypothetical protein [Williamwhitmania taraxaci]|uniref:Uncharacterized protein n=1 Tax=Williamwhitmania taraxaci TaxID=1640674 RepID=A0A1G6TZF0_9BACT|nr:hypothetical protein [Williamwhitmania taraxaci]SDD34458.1 hypothetical protein SAMN05216323_11444 [Williamwhitmania taraxaci]